MSLRGAFVVAPSHIVQARNENNLAAQPVARTGEGDAARTPRHECRRRRTPACGDREYEGAGLPERMYVESLQGRDATGAKDLRGSAIRPAGADVDGNIA